MYSGIRSAKGKLSISTSDPASDTCEKKGNNFDIPEWGVSDSYIEWKMITAHVKFCFYCAVQNVKLSST